MSKFIKAWMVLSLILISFGAGYSFKKPEHIEIDKIKIEKSLPIDAVDLVSLINSARINNSVPALTYEPALSEIAGIRSNEIAITGTWSHTRPDGTRFTTAATKVNFNYYKLGENLAKCQRTKQDVVNEWLQSPSHYETIMDHEYNKIGYGISYSGTCFVTVIVLAK